MKFYQSSLLKQFSNITSTFTTKKSGNLAFHVGDKIENVIANHQLLADELSYELHALIHMKQIHSNIVHRVTKDDNFSSPPTCDALITNEKNRPLMVMVADCSAILFYDAKREVIAVAHAGRAGAFTNIVQNVIDSFLNDYGSNLQDLYVSIGASIKECCYEVGAEIYQEAKELDLDYAILLRNHSYYLDISAILKKQLLDAGVEEKNIEISQECSACVEDKYYSYRMQKETGRFAALISLND